jgi:carbon starvation protein
MGGTLYPPLKDLNWRPGVIGTSLAIVGSWGYLLATGTVSTIWPMFGAANQLLGMLALCIATTVLIKMGKARYLWVTAVPMVFVGVITLSGSYGLLLFFIQKAGLSRGNEGYPYYLDAALVGLVAVLAIVVLADSSAKWYGFLIQKKPLTTSESAPHEGGIKMPAGPCC